MISYILMPVKGAITSFQKIVSLSLSNSPLTLLALGAGLSVEEVYYGFRIIKYLGLLG